MNDRHVYKKKNETKMLWESLYGKNPCFQGIIDVAHHTPCKQFHP